MKDPINAHAPHARCDETHEKNCTATPKEFIQAIQNQLMTPGESFSWDLAASTGSEKAPKFITPEEDSFTKEWYALEENKFHAYLNPPYAKIGPWIKKACEETRKGDKLTVWILVPASVDTKYWMEYVTDQAREVRWVSPRIKFEGHTHSFPKPLALLTFSNTSQVETSNYSNWNWKQ